MQNIPVFNPASPEGKAISDLFLAVLVICGVILAIVTGLVVYSLVRSRVRPGAGEPRQIFGNRRLEILWTVVPFLVLVWIFALTVRAMRISDPSGVEPPDLTVIGHQWWWEVRYAKSPVVTANEIHIPAGERLSVRLESADVIHDFWAPQLGRKMDMIPGLTNHIWLEAERPGTYLGACAEYCGAEHAWMRFLVIAEPTAAFAAWAAHQAEPAPAPTTGPEERGRQLFLQMTCVNCHPIRGVAALANAAPDLTHVASRRTLGAGVLQNTPANLARWLKNPQAIKPSCKMPNLNLSDAQVGDLVSFFESLR
jgi:cytochrome c oxidase subunit II